LSQEFQSKQARRSNNSRHTDSSQARGEHTMSEDISQIRIDPNEEITEAKKLILLNQWKNKVQGEIDDYTAEKNKLFDAYKKQKEKFDRLLAVKLKKTKKYDMVINSRKKVLVDIIKEIAILEPQKTEDSGSALIL